MNRAATASCNCWQREDLGVGWGRSSRNLDAFPYQASQTKTCASIQVGSRSGESGKSQCVCLLDGVENAKRDVAELKSGPIAGAGCGVGGWSIWGRGEASQALRKTQEWPTWEGRGSRDVFKLAGRLFGVPPILPLSSWFTGRAHWAKRGRAAQRVRFSKHVMGQGRGADTVDWQRTCTQQGKLAGST